MRKLANIAIVGAVYAAGWIAAGMLLDGAYGQVVPDIAKWLWGIGAMIISILAQLSWKIHETKRVEGLSIQQRSKLRKISGLLSWRIYLIGLIVFASSVAGFASSYVSDTTISTCLTQGSLGAMLASAVLCAILVPLMQRDIQRFEDRAREDTITRAAADTLAKKLSSN